MDTGSTTAVTTATVTYQVKGGPGTGAADLTYSFHGDTQQESDVRLPWRTTFTGDVGEFVYISAQNLGFGSITCEILVDGTVVKHTTSSGQYTICSASGSL